MIQIKTFVFNPFQENTYVLYDDTKECVIVDSGCYTQSEQQELVEFIESNKLKPKYAINTHGHVDHVLGSSFVKNHFNIDILGHPEDLPLMQMAVKQGLMFGITIDDVPTIDININDGDTIMFGSSELAVIHTPGHTLGGVCLLSQKGEFVISGDTLFQGSIGRTDLPGGDYNQLISSIENKLLTLNQDYKVYPGHGDPTTIGWENKNNPFLTKQ
jgi:glyoxylase-like metal-dependent hydrolase (beta-lactamase superfamily II)